MWLNAHIRKGGTLEPQEDGDLGVRTVLDECKLCTPPEDFNQWGIQEQGNAIRNMKTIVWCQIGTPGLSAFSQADAWHYKTENKLLSFCYSKSSVLLLWREDHCFSQVVIPMVVSTPRHQRCSSSHIFYLPACMEILTFKRYFPKLNGSWTSVSFATKI